MLPVPSPSAALGLCLSASVLLGCPAVYPELGTRIQAVGAARELTPPPPPNLKWIRVVSARIPERARDGRRWDQAFGSLPDPYVKVFVNGTELFRTPAESDTLEPTFAKAPRGNFVIEPEDKLRVEVWDSNPLNDRPIGVRDIGRVSEDQKLARRIRVELEGGAQAELAFEPAHALLGVGLWYELRTSTCFITRLLAESPATRAGVQPGDEVLRIGGRDVAQLDQDEIRSAFGAIPSAGLPLILRRANGTTTNVVLKEGPIYPTYSAYGSID